MSSDVLARVRAEIDARLVQLRPAVAEYERLLDAERALDADAAEATDNAKLARGAKAVRGAKTPRVARAVGAPKAVAATTSRETKAQTVARKQEKEQPLEAASVLASARSTPPPATARRGRRGSAAGAIKRAASSQHDAAQQAIVAALEHGSHTLGELVLVTAIAASELRQGVRHLQHAGTIARTQRDGRAAYALSGASTG
jgi:hypothetical protein